MVLVVKITGYSGTVVMPTVVVPATAAEGKQPQDGKPALRLVKPSD